jgi:hypothetical protein
MVAQGAVGHSMLLPSRAQRLKGFTVVKQHRLVNEALKKEIEGIHGLQVRSWLPTLLCCILITRVAQNHPAVMMCTCLILRCNIYIAITDRP